MTLQKKNLARFLSPARRDLLPGTSSGSYWTLAIGCAELIISRSTVALSANTTGIPLMNS